MKRILVIILGITVLLSGSMFWNSRDAAAKEQGGTYLLGCTMRIEGKQYKWREASFGGTNRGYEINPGKYRYQLSPNPHKDPWYNKNQVKFYNQGADQIEKQANEEKWQTKGWPDTIKNITIHGIEYKLTK
ncbi:MULTISPECIES: hypothetical protein [Enterococcus]|uniref:Uncharacterized protein n=1 Tax=Enterococcus mundtii TaxID=53346 RepID=A0AAI8WCQ6_ENTMU|nr:hypothetical protein [Enterococcus mundtii]MBE9912026.1 hypothetical protein [Enterococcus mundtii]QCJ56719.1 hypothetical protein DDJ96_08875 [Enterococcus mundtii]BAO07321.1 hypothetical protein PDENDC454_26318 [Enterococcus mundtii QU 25]BBM13658.1 uncharacterized protein EM151A_0417 [Enterococcus mundtii]GKS53934.1 hypothetical protein EMLAB_05490 [Enterococcus mundtii]